MATTPVMLIENVTATIIDELCLALNNTHCRRCGGLMVDEHCTDLFDDTGRMEFPALRCVQCGEVVDAVILLNRIRRPASPARRPTRWTMKQREGTGVH